MALSPAARLAIRRRHHHHRRHPQQQPQDSGDASASASASASDDQSQGQDEGDDQGDSQDQGQQDQTSQQDQPAGEFGMEGLHVDPRVQRILQGLQRTRRATAKRETILEPNKDLPLGIERYTMAIVAAQTVPIQTSLPKPIPQQLTGSQAPDVDFRPQRLSTNSPSPGFVTISMAKVANVNVVVGGQIDAWQLNANAWEEELDLPTLTPANNASFVALYTGLIVLPFSAAVYQFIMSASGPATVTGLLLEGFDG
jgi:hypothetical protein